MLAPYLLRGLIAMFIIHIFNILIKVRIHFHNRWNIKWTDFINYSKVTCSIIIMYKIFSFKIMRLIYVTFMNIAWNWLAGFIRAALMLFWLWWLHTCCGRIWLQTIVCSLMRVMTGKISRWKYHGWSTWAQHDCHWIPYKCDLLC